MIRSLAAGVLLLASAAHAEDAPLSVRQLAGINISASDSGAGLGAQLGIRLSSVLLRLTAELGGSSGPRGYIMASVRADWVHPMTDSTALVTGFGFGSVSYGFIFDDPVANVQVLTPEIGVLFGKDRWLGRIFAGLTPLVPLGSVAHPRDNIGQAVLPPHVMATVLFSL